MAKAFEGDFLIVEGTIPKAEIQCRTGRTVVHLGFLRLAFDSILGAVVDVVGQLVPTVDRAVLLADFVVVPFTEF